MALISLVEISTGTVSGFVSAYNQSVSALNTDLTALSAYAAGRFSTLSELGSALVVSGAFRVADSATILGLLSVGGLTLLSGSLTQMDVPSAAQTLPLPTSCAFWWRLTIDGTSYRIPVFSAG